MTSAGHAGSNKLGHHFSRADLLEATFFQVRRPDPTDLSGAGGDHELVGVVGPIVGRADHR